VSIPPNTGQGGEPWRSAWSPGNLPERFKEKKFDPYDTTLYPKGFPSDPELMHRIFDFSDETRTIFHTARNRRPKTVSPIAKLLYDLMRCGMRCPVDTRLFPGTPLSSYVVVVGRSGTGKSEAAKEDASPWPGAALPAPKWLADNAARRVVPEHKAVTPAPAGGAAPSIATPSLQPVLIPHDFDKTESIGSGQAITDHLIDIVGKGADAFAQMLPHPAVLLEEDEMLTLLKSSKSDGSTIVPTLNSAWTGADIGNSTRTHGHRRTTGKYSVFLWAGLQPKFVHELLRHDDSGFFQRTFLCPVTDPYRHVNEPPIPQPGTRPVPMPVINPGDMFTAAPEVHAEIEAGTEDSDYDHLPDPADEAKSHAMQARIRLACLGALLHGTLHITKELWEWTIPLMEVCDRVDAWMRAEAHFTAEAVQTAEGEARAVIQASKDAFASGRKVEVAERLYDYLAAAGSDGLTRKPLRVKLKGGPAGGDGGERNFFDTAIDHLLKLNTITFDGTRYRVKSPTPAPATAPAPGGGIAGPGGAVAASTPLPQPTIPAPTDTTENLVSTNENPISTEETPAPTDGVSLTPGNKFREFYAGLKEGAK
jgi:hypothetical protein